MNSILPIQQRIQSMFVIGLRTPDKNLCGLVDSVGATRWVARRYAFRRSGRAGGLPLPQLLMGTLALLLGCRCCLAAGSSAPATSTTSRVSLNVRDFGAKGDGQTRDTAVTQKALDACAASGGGTVIVPRGIYLIGSVVLGSNTTLQLERGANLVGSPDIADYPLVRIRWEGEFTEGHRALLSAEKADNVAIVGPGSIFGPPLSVRPAAQPARAGAHRIGRGHERRPRRVHHAIPATLVHSPARLPESHGPKSHHSLGEFQWRRN